MLYFHPNWAEIGEIGLQKIDKGVLNRGENCNKTIKMNYKRGNN